MVGEELTRVSNTMRAGGILGKFMTLYRHLLASSAHDINPQYSPMLPAADTKTTPIPYTLKKPHTAQYNAVCTIRGVQT